MLLQRCRIGRLGFKIFLIFVCGTAHLSAQTITTPPKPRAGTVPPAQTRPVQVTSAQLSTTPSTTAQLKPQIVIPTTMAQFRSVHTTSALVASDGLIEQLMRSKPEKFQLILDSSQKYCVQILYTQINHTKTGKILFEPHSYRLDPKEYFYPASTIKFPAAVLALEKLNDIIKKTRMEAVFTKDSPLRIDSSLSWQRAAKRDLTSADSLPSLAHFIKKVLLVSDNDAYNRLYEFLGHDYLNEQLHKKGFTDLKITRRLSIGTTPDYDRITNELLFYMKSGQQLYRQSVTTATKSYTFELNGLQQGAGFIRRDSLVLEPMNFVSSNYISLETLQEILKTVIFPEAVPAKQRFNLTKDDYDFLYRYMGMLPRESDYPRYDTTFNDSYVKFLMFGDTKEPMPKNIRIFNKVGDAYGYMIDNAYIVDFDSGVEFLLSAVIYANDDGVFNDDIYGYDQVSLPFLANLGKVVYEYELTRKRTQKTDLKRLQTIIASIKPPPPIVVASPLVPTKAGQIKSSSATMQAVPTKTGQVKSSTATIQAPPPAKPKKN